MRTSIPKFLKTLIVMICCFASTASYSQTKEETITWLKEKLEKSLVPSESYITYVVVESFSECQFSIKLLYNKQHHRRYTIPTKGLTIHKDGNISFDIQAIKEEQLQDGTSNAVFEKRYLSNAYYFGIANNEPDLHNRLIKAFTHLATFCHEKKETF